MPDQLPDDPPPKIGPKDPVPEGWVRSKKGNLYRNRPPRGASTAMDSRHSTGLKPGSSRWQAAMNKKDREFVRGVFYQCATEEDFRDVVGDTIQRAKRGDPTARYIFLTYLMGKPEERIEVAADGTLAQMMRALDEPKIIDVGGN